MELYCLPRAPPLFLTRLRPCPFPRTPSCFSSSKAFSARFRQGLHWTRASAPEESVTTVSEKFEEPSVPKKEVDFESFSVEEDRNGSEKSKDGDFLSNLDVKVELNETYNVVFFGAGALLALWVSSAVVSSIDSIPLFPKVMEVVGLGYSIWFISRFLIFKKNREELFSKIEALKEQIIGQSENG